MEKACAKPLAHAFFIASLLILFHIQHSRRVQHGQHHDADVGEDGRPHAGDAQRAEDEADALDAQRKWACPSGCRP